MPDVTRALAAVATELKRQDDKWGVQDHPDDVEAGHWVPRGEALEFTARYSLSEETVSWAAILAEEVGEALQADDPEALRAELVQVAAVAIQWAAAIDRRESKS